LSDPEVPDEAYIAAAIADRGFVVERSPGGFDAEVRFKQPHAGYNARGGVAVDMSRAREFAPKLQYMEDWTTCREKDADIDNAVYGPVEFAPKENLDEHDRPEPADHPPAAELSAAPPGDAKAAPALKKRKNSPTRR
jgi:hypothetical protein